MSTAELGLSLAEMIRQDKVHAICCTGANLEEDVFNLVAHDHYKRIPQLARAERRRRTGTPGAAPEPGHRHLHPGRRSDAANRKSRLEEWVHADQEGRKLFPHEFFYSILRDDRLKKVLPDRPQRQLALCGRCKKICRCSSRMGGFNLGNMYAGHCISGDVKNVHTVRTGIEYMMSLADWYTKTSEHSSIGFFQIAGGIAGDFPICVVPMLHQDLQRENIPRWGYFCQISDSTTSYGSYSGAVPNEKITWGKLSLDTPKFIIESDATIVAPLIFAWVLGW